MLKKCSQNYFPILKAIIFNYTEKRFEKSFWQPNSFAMKTCIHLTISVLISLLLGGQSIAQPTTPEIKYELTDEEQLNDDSHYQKIVTFYNGGDDGTFQGEKEVPIYYKIFRQQGDEKGAILISSGRTEAALKYQELIYDLFRNGYSVYIMDHRGQGLSGRMAEDPEMGYIDDFQFFVDDMKQFYDRFLIPGNHKKAYLLAHSMGGTIGFSYLEQHPDDFDAAAFSSPMLGLSAYICPLAKILSGKTPKYAPGQSGYDNDSASFEGNTVTGSRVRYLRKIEVYELVPQARLGGASIQWLSRSCKHIRTIFRNIKLIQTPFILFQADNETVVNPKAYGKFIKKALKMDKECQISFIDDAQHELLMEKDPQRTKTITETLQFFEKY
jgi:lysophospholipase